MRLWHQDLISRLPRQQLLGQHRECCALRGNGWGKRHSTVDYVFENDFSNLVSYHNLIISEMEFREYKVNQSWKVSDYRGNNCEPYKSQIYTKSGLVYSEHNDNYLNECLDNLKRKGISL